MGSLFALPFEQDFWSEKIKSKFQKRMVSSDFKKTSAPNFLNKEADIYLIDLIDERFHLVEPSKGVRFTLSAELNEVMEDDYLKFRIIRQSSDEYMKLWKEGWYKLVEELNLRNNLEKVLINKVLWLKETESGLNFDSTLCSKMNAMLEEMYKEQSKVLKAHQFLEYEKKILKCADTHKWGPAPFHYTSLSHEHARKRMQCASKKQI